MRSKWQGKNANKVSDQQRQLMRERLHQYRPIDLQISQGLYWRVSDLAKAVEQWFGVLYQDEGSYHQFC